MLIKSKIFFLSTLYLILYYNSSQHNKKSQPNFCFTEKVFYLLKPSVLPPAHSTPLSQKMLYIT